MPEKQDSREIQHAVDEAFSIERFESKGFTHINEALLILSEAGVLWDVGKVDCARFGIEGVNNSGKSCLIEEILNKQSEISGRFSIDNDFYNNIIFQKLAVLREPPAFLVEEYVRNALGVSSDEFTYRQACKYLVKHPFQQMLSFMISRNHLHHYSNFLSNFVSSKSEKRIEELFGDDIKIPDQVIRDIEKEAESGVNPMLYNNGIDFYHDRSQLSSMVYQAKGISDLLGMNYDLSAEETLKAHIKMQDMGKLNPFSGFIVLFSSRNNPKQYELPFIGVRKARDKDQYEDLFSARKETVLYSRVVDIARRTLDVPIAVLVNDINGVKNSINDLIYISGNILSIFKHCPDTAEKEFQMRLPIDDTKYIMELDRKTQKFHDIRLGEVSIKDGWIKWTPQKWYENLPLQSEL